MNDRSIRTQGWRPGCQRGSRCPSRGRRWESGVGPQGLWEPACCGSLDSFPSLLLQRVGLSQKSWLRPGSGVHSCPDTEPPFPTGLLCFRSSAQEVLPSLTPESEITFCLRAVALVSGEHPTCQTSVWAWCCIYWKCSKKDLPYLLILHACSLPIPMPSCMVSFQKSQAR